MIAVVLLVVGAATVATAFVRSACRRPFHRPRAIELVEALERKALPSFAQECTDFPARDHQDVVDLRRLEWNYGTVRSGHAPTANDYARAVGMPTPSSGVKRR